MLEVTTESGSVYQIDPDKKTWARQQGPGASTIRTDAGTFEDITIEIGESMALLCPPLPGTEADGRMIFSTPIQSVRAY